MPFSQRVVAKREDVETIIMDQKNPNILEKAAVSNMVGLMTQLNDLSKFASEVFGHILQQSDQQISRIKKCRQRIKAIEVEVPSAEKRLVEYEPSYFYDNPYTGKEFARRDRINGLLFRRDRSTIEVNRRRGLADPPPDLALMDRFSKSGPCLKLFSDADFFLNEWLEAEKARIAEEKRKRKQKKLERKAKREAKKPKEEKSGKKKIKRVKKKIYSKYGAEYQAEEKQIEGDYVEFDDRIIDTVGSVYDSVESTEKDIQKRSISVGTKKEAGVLKSRVPAAGSTAMPIGESVAAVASTTPMGELSGETGVIGPPPARIDPASKRISMHIVQPSYGGPAMVAARVAVGSDADVRMMPPRAEDIEIRPEEMTVEMRIAASQRLAEQQAMFDEAKRAKLAAQQAEAKLVVGGGKSVLLASIQQGISLKKTAVVKREIKKDKRSIMLESISLGGRGLKTVDHAAIQAVKKREREEEEASNTIFAALNARRGLIADDSDSDSSWESEDDWDSDD